MSDIQLFRLISGTAYELAGRTQAPAGRMANAKKTEDVDDD